MNPPLFVFGAPRSGTTKLARTLSAHPEVHVEHELRVVEVALLLGRVLLGIPHTATDAADTQRALTAGAPAARALLQQRRAATGASWVGDKFPHYSAQLNVLEYLFPGFRAVLILRDGRDVAQSIRSTTTNRRAWRRVARRPTFPQALDQWCESAKYALAAMDKLGGRLHVVRYEDAARAPDDVCASFERFLGLTASDALRAEMRTVRPRHDWRDTLSAYEQQQAATHPLAPRLLARLGYPPTPRGPAEPDTPERCFARAGSSEAPIADWCRVLDAPWGPLPRQAAHALAARADAPEALWGLAHLVEHGRLDTPDDREAVVGLLAARGLPADLARAVVGGS